MITNAYIVSKDKASVGVGLAADGAEFFVREADCCLTCVISNAEDLLYFIAALEALVPRVRQHQAERATRMKEARG